MWRWVRDGKVRVKREGRRVSVSLEDARKHVGDGQAADVATMLREHLESVMRIHLDGQTLTSKALLASIDSLREENDALRKQRSELADELATAKKELRELLDATIDRTLELEEATAKREKTEAMTRMVGQLVAKRTGATVSPEALAKVVQFVAGQDKASEPKVSDDVAKS